MTCYLMGNFMAKYFPLNKYYINECYSLYTHGSSWILPVAKPCSFSATSKIPVKTKTFPSGRTNAFTSGASMTLLKIYAAYNHGTSVDSSSKDPHYIFQLALFSKPATRIMSEATFVTMRTCLNFNKI